MTSARTNNRLGYLDGWRGLAILSVLIGHFLNLPIILFGRLGVELFFALSGRLMAEILFEKQFPLGKFISRRFSRIFPALLAFVIVLMIATRLTIWPVESQPVAVSTAASVLTFTYGYLRDVVVLPQHILEHTWSLAVEEHAYFILAFVAFLGRKHIARPAVFILIIALASIIDGSLRTYAFHQDYYQAYWVTDSKLSSIFLPAFIYLHRDTLISWLGRGAPIAAIIAGGIGVLLFYHNVPTVVTYTLAPLMFGISMACLPVAHEWLIAVLENRVVRQIGLMSYSIYLWQQPFMALGEQKGLLVRLALLVPVLGCAAISYYGVERPARRWLNARIGGRSERSRRLVEVG
ncbi:acyltransferase family protein [Sphingomonas sp. MMS24-J13]|uniref:acyltransferase family protein n=1 Tax=Sphingomonas sp. MMS24-J13 TaxID=3238686 RepID=UPI00384B2902